jgi:hypothetical protein
MNSIRCADLLSGFRLKKVTKMSLLSLQNRRKLNAMEAKGTEQNSFRLATGHDLYEVRPRKGRDGFDLISELFRYGPIWYAGPDAVRNAIAYAKYRSHFRSQRAIIRVLDHSGAVVQMHE